MPEPETTVRYRSSGRVALLGPPEIIREACRLDWPSPLRPTPLPAPPAIEGYLGAFLLGGERFDLIVDLFPEPLLRREILPFGYFHVGSDLTELRAILPELTDWVGEFEKPKFFHDDPDRCAHGYGNLKGCERCLAVCAAEAISSKGSEIEIDHIDTKELSIVFSRSLQKGARSRSTPTSVGGVATASRSVPPGRFGLGLGPP